MAILDQAHDDLVRVVQNGRHVVRVDDRLLENVQSFRFDRNADRLLEMAIREAETEHAIHNGHQSRIDLLGRFALVGQIALFCVLIDAFRDDRAHVLAVLGHIEQFAGTERVDQ